MGLNAQPSGDKPGDGRILSAPGPWPIEDGIPIPDIYEKRAKKEKWSRGYVGSIRLLRVGQSVLIPTTLLVMCQVCSQEERRMKRKVKYLKRQMDGGIRIWRTK